ncbi:hypothetical protein 2 [Hubei dimarhabdovirus virus 2]|uniref:hypothetical protein 2 n=1 Tax=Hubei dimarhabdovirus virus 2 TaxID=1922867 RepID=UPI00090C4186|nr:hypothetical protein 2 [Hubei dimarhabdovirus virus 2]APG78720.1 hypothetical protein 2 [Hubei dimarhabdovirus virus 2]
MYSLQGGLTDVKEVLNSNPNYLRKSYQMSTDEEKYSTPPLSASLISEDCKNLTDQWSEAPIIPTDGMVDQGLILEMEIDNEKDHASRIEMSKLKTPPQDDQRNETSKRSRIITPEEDKWNIAIDMGSLSLQDKMSFKEAFKKHVDAFVKGCRIPLNINYDIEPMDIQESKIRVIKTSSPSEGDSMAMAQKPPDPELNDTQKKLYSLLLQGMELPLLSNPKRYFVLKIGKDEFEGNAVLDVIIRSPDLDIRSLLRRVISISQQKKMILNLYKWDAKI